MLNFGDVSIICSEGLTSCRTHGRRIGSMSHEFKSAFPNQLEESILYDTFQNEIESISVFNSEFV
jgi:hypothetical protein